MCARLTAVALRKVQAKAARNVAERKAQALLEGITDFEPVTDPVAELERLAGRAVRWLEVLEGIVAELHRIRYTTQAELALSTLIWTHRSTADLAPPVFRGCQWSGGWAG